MNINWKVRLQHRAFWAGLVPALLLLAQSVAALFGFSLDLSVAGERLLDVVNALFALLTLLGIVTDPTTEGVRDSDRALSYRTPSGE